MIFSRIARNIISLSIDYCTRFKSATLHAVAMNANAGRRGRSRVREQEEHELADMVTASYPGLAGDSRNVRGTHNRLPQTQRQSRWRFTSYPYPILISLAVIALIASGVCFSVGMNLICSTYFPEMNNANISESAIAYSLATSTSCVLPTTSTITSSANRHGQPHHAQIRQHSTSSTGPIRSDPTASDAWVPGLYLIPMPVSHLRESAILQFTSLSQSSPSTLQEQQLQEHEPHHLATFPSIPTTMAPRATAQAAKHAPYVTLGVTMLPRLNHRSFSQRLLIFCVNNVCSVDTTLASMCNDSIPQTVYERKECEWCWDNSSHVLRPNGTAIHVHCQEVVKHSVKTLWIVGSLCLFPLIVISIILLRRCIASQKKKTAAARRLSKPIQRFEPGRIVGFGSDYPTLDPTRSNNSKGHEASRKETKWFGPQRLRGKIGGGKQENGITAMEDMNMNTCSNIPHSIDTEIFSNIREMGQGKLLEGSNSQEDSLGLSRTSSRRERVLHSRNATVPAILIHRARGSSSNAEVQSAPECVS